MEPANVYARLSGLEASARPLRKGSIPVAGPESDRRPARYVGFVGDTYAYLTPGHGVPVVSDLVRHIDPQQARIAIRTVEQLRVGEYVLFRDHGDRDVISLFAEQVIGPVRYRERRAIADRWRAALRSVAPTPAEVYRRLRDAGVRKHAVTIRSWLMDPDKIGPGSREDLVAVAHASGDAAFLADVDTIWAAMGELRSAHVAAGPRLSDFLLAELPQKLTAVRDRETFVDLTLGQAWVVEIEEIGELEERACTEVDRLLWDVGSVRWRTPTVAGGLTRADAGTGAWPR
jgi:hypothetical protein